MDKEIFSERQSLQLMILHSIAVLSGYIIPGLIENNKFKKINSTLSV